MTDTIQISIKEKGTDRGSTIFLPKPMHEIMDELDREKIFGDVTAKVLSARIIPELSIVELTEESTLAELNFLAERLGEISDEDETLYAYSTWWGNENELNTNVFRQELDDVINALRKDGLLKSRSEMMKFCGENSHLPLGESRGFAVETQQHLFLLRCKPQVGDYDCYCYCYNKQELQIAQSQQQNQSSGPMMSM